MAKKASGSKAKASTPAAVSPVASTSTLSPNSNRKRSRAASTLTADDDAKGPEKGVDEASGRGGKRKKRNTPAPDVLEEEQGSTVVASTSAGTAEVAMLDVEVTDSMKTGKKDKKEKKQKSAVLLEKEETPASSSTVDVDEVEVRITPTDKKGKGRAKDQGAAAREEASSEVSPPAEETIRLRKEISFKDTVRQKSRSLT